MFYCCMKTQSINSYEMQFHVDLAFILLLIICYYNCVICIII